MSLRRPKKSTRTRILLFYPRAQESSTGCVAPVRRGGRALQTLSSQKLLGAKALTNISSAACLGVAYAPRVENLTFWAKPSGRPSAGCSTGIGDSTYETLPSAVFHFRVGCFARREDSASSGPVRPT